jgi:hypothetical protein
MARIRSARMATISIRVAKTTTNGLSKTSRASTTNATTANNIFMPGGAAVNLSSTFLNTWCPL